MNVHFLRDKIEESRLKCLLQQTAGTHRCGEAAIGRRADSCYTAPGLVPALSWPRSLLHRFFATKIAEFF
jgi:hypothetical protein